MSVFCAKCGQSGHTHAACIADKRCNCCFQKGHIEKDCPQKAKKFTLASRRNFDAYYGSKKIGNKDSTLDDEGSEKPILGPEYSLIFEPRVASQGSVAQPDTTAMNWSKVETMRSEWEKLSEDPMASYNK
ncbi:developmentally regulated GTP-binding protein [Perkinsela sp. CCAP 1560/4]|nr:developmentally regulated GTP-binding protein [Perkinsela sp. CCAP 1560/4]|eukprot:KNH06829.1 developmentally regulated GTP-binding protein [Perkinsela sp. CCAP 1560/4]